MLSEMSQEQIKTIIVDGFQWTLIGLFVLLVLFLIAYIMKLRKQMKKENLEKEILKEPRENGREKIYE